jgi:hypothetical protein
MAMPDVSTRLQNFFNEHILVQLPVLKGAGQQSSMLYKSGKMNLQGAMNFFEDRKFQGPTYPCCCCRRTWFWRSVRTVTADFERKLQAKVSDCLTGLLGPNGYQNLCHGCYEYLRAGQSPKLNYLNMADFPPIPEDLKGMTDMENHLVASRIPFMKIYPRGVQRGVLGGMVNVPANLTKTQQQLPRQLHFWSL